MYNGNVYRSNLFPLRSVALTKLFNSHTVAIRCFYDIPRETHKYIAASIGGRHLKTQIYANKINFYKRLQNNSKMAVVFLFNAVKDNLRTNTGMDCRLLVNEAVNLSILHQEGSILDINTFVSNRCHAFEYVLQEEQYRINVLDVKNFYEIHSLL